MTNLNQLAREIEQSEAAAEGLSNIINIMWNTLKMPDEYKTQVIVKWIEVTMKPPPTQGNFTEHNN